MVRSFQDYTSQFGALFQFDTLFQFNVAGGKSPMYWMGFRNSKTTGRGVGDTGAPANRFKYLRQALGALWFPIL